MLSLPKLLDDIDLFFGLLLLLGLTSNSDSSKSEIWIGSYIEPYLEESWPPPMIYLSLFTIVLFVSVPIFD